MLRPLARSVNNCYSRPLLVVAIVSMPIIATVRSAAVAVALPTAIAGGLFTVIAALRLPAAGVFTIGNVANSAVVSPSTVIHKAMTSPAVAIAPAGPWAHAHKDTVVEVSRPVISDGGTGIGRIPVVTVRTGGLNADVNGNLRLGCWY